MGSMSIWHWAIVALIVLVLFGKGRISEMMGDLGKGIKSFKKGMSEEEAASAAAAQVAHTPADGVAAKKAADESLNSAQNR